MQLMALRPAADRQIVGTGFRAGRHSEFASDLTMMMVTYYDRH
jgi:hypothetical protein